MKVLIFDDEEIGISAYDQCWKKEDFISLRDDYNIIQNAVKPLTLVMGYKACPPNLRK